MLTWNVTYHCKPGQRDAFFQALCQLGVRNNSIHEEGNLKYDYFFDAQNTDALLLVESWTTSINSTTEQTAPGSPRRCFYNWTTRVAMFRRKAPSCSTNSMVGRYVKSSSSTCIRLHTSM